MRWRSCFYRLIILGLVVGGVGWLLHYARHQGHGKILAPVDALAEFFTSADVPSEFEVRCECGPILLPISTLEEFHAVSGDDAFWPMEIWARWDHDAPESFRVSLKSFDSQGSPLSSGQVITMEKRSEKADSAGRYCYRPTTRIAFVGSRELESSSVDRVGVYFRDGCETRVAFVD